MKSNISPSELLSELLKNASPRKKRSLVIIYDVCKEQHERGSDDFSPVTIGHYSEKAGGPVARTIRNKEGELYRSLMNTWANYTGGVTRKPKGEKESSIIDEIQGRISDPTVRALVGLTMAENSKLKGENSLLKRHIGLTIDMRPNARPILASGENVEITPPNYNLLPSEIEALKHAISNEFLNDQSWEVDEQGRIKYKGRTIFKVGFVTAIKKVLESIERSNL